MAAVRHPSFLKRQKEQKRLERANARRVARQTRRTEKAARRSTDQDPIEDMPMPVEEGAPTHDAEPS